MRRGGREAEGGGLLNRYTLSRRIVGSNPIPSAKIDGKDRKIGIFDSKGNPVKRELSIGSGSIVKVNGPMVSLDDDPGVDMDAIQVIKYVDIRPFDAEDDEDGFMGQQRQWSVIKGRHAYVATPFGKLNWLATRQHICADYREGAVRLFDKGIQWQFRT